jgi:hypothetical protein
MRRYATSERTMNPAKASTVRTIRTWKKSIYQPRTRRLRNPDQLRRRERYHRAVDSSKMKSLTTNRN